MSEFDPKSVIVKKKGAEDTSRVPLMDCPKCGFWTPIDPYCASCGVEMATVKRKRKPSPMNPAVIAGSMALLVIAAFVLLRPSSEVDSGTENLTTEMSDSAGGAARPTRTAKAPKQNTFLKAMSQLTGVSDDDEATDEVTPSASVAASSLAPADSEATSSAANALVTDLDGDPALGRSARAPETPPKDPAAAAAKGKPEVLVAFLWVEVSKEWLQVMGASELGVHSIPDLETRLREAQGSYNILSATRHRVSEKPDPIDIAGPERSAVRFDLVTTLEAAPGGAGVAATLTGLAQTAARQAADGSVRNPTSAPLTIEKGEGTILNLGKAPIRPGASGGSTSTGAEIVVLILPRWVDDRNP